MQHSFEMYYSSFESVYVMFYSRAGTDLRWELFILRSVVWYTGLDENSTNGCHTGYVHVHVVHTLLDKTVEFFLCLTVVLLLCLTHTCSFVTLTFSLVYYSSCSKDTLLTLDT